MGCRACRSCTARRGGVAQCSRPMGSCRGPGCEELLQRVEGHGWVTQLRVLERFWTVVLVLQPSCSAHDGRRAQLGTRLGRHVGICSLSSTLHRWVLQEICRV